VLVHGWSCDRSYWRGQVDALASRHRLVTLDLGGHGESGRQRAHWTIDAFGADVAAVVDVLDLPAAILVGHSMGGNVVVAAAPHLGERVLGLVWVDTYRELASFPSAVAVAGRVAQFQADFAPQVRAFVRRLFAPRANPVLVERVAEAMASAPPDIALAALEAAWNDGRGIVAALRALHLPLVAINPADPLTDSASLSGHGIAVLQMPGVDHFPMLEKPEAFNACLLDAVRRIIDTRGAPD
jgi:pimeloyl-ACP methyl ester carboxylesterase